MTTTVSHTLEMKKCTFKSFHLKTYPQLAIQHQLRTFQKKKKNLSPYQRANLISLTSKEVSKSLFQAAELLQLLPEAQDLYQDLQEFRIKFKKFHWDQVMESQKQLLLELLGLSPNHS